ncbi:DUF1702 family protein [Micromonospora sp. KC723]|uniref:DUF1702 family protein n=1 Tax=Micromonospora sp. KC723 TaxID=2530381 RepID=UPI0010517CA8|nr:DUF1702 family protein [Micromonospora sp. KC723]TDB72561.1 DUF1702 family protein [Micromonospora sp. KC723]
MTTYWRALRRRILTPDVSQTRLDVRGFHIKSPAARTVLETVGQSFLAGFSAAAESRTDEEFAPRLDEFERRFRGFAYEGAAMALAIVDGLSPVRGRRVERFLDGAGSAHVYMAYVGVGWAMARLPRLLWRRLAMPDPLLRWLALDGYGFHQAYFHTDRYVRARYQEPGFRWPGGGPPGYANRAIDQGIGRALWFVCGTDPDLVVDTIGRFAPHRRADLFGGAGLAATYAGGGDEAELRAFWQRAGEYRPQLAQGSAFGATARVRAGLVVPHNELAAEVFCGMSTARAAELTEQRRPNTPDGDQLPAYEIWRQRVADEFVAIGRN